MVKETDRKKESKNMMGGGLVTCRHSPPSPGNFLSPTPSPCHLCIPATLSPIPLASGPVSLLSCDLTHPWPLASFIQATEKRAQAQEGGRSCLDMPITLDHRPRTEMLQGCRFMRMCNIVSDPPVPRPPTLRYYHRGGMSVALVYVYCLRH